MILEILREGDGIGPRLAKIGAQIINAKRLRAKRSQQCIPRRRTDSLIAISPLKKHALGGQSVNIRRFGQRVTISTNIWLEIIHTDKQHIRPTISTHKQHDQGDKEQSMDVLALHLMNPAGLKPW
jgi:hypothetical protein